MKLISAEFQNFRLLRDLRVEFSRDQERSLTVIRAENETGKTTILNALQWALYGDNALPNKGQDYRLHPIDWNTSQGRQVPISAQVYFETASYRQRKDGLHGVTRRFRIVRSTFETLDGVAWDRSPSTVRLFLLSDSGSDPVSSPEALIHDALPPELREVFFTDGDRALSFIESSVSTTTKRESVQKAIRSLLGLGVIEDALRHVKKTAADVNKTASKMASDDKLTKITARLDEIDSTSSEHEDKIADAKSQFAAFDEKLAGIDKQINEALVKGDREKLKRDLQNTKKQLEGIREQCADAAKEHTSLFKGQSLAREILAPILMKALQKLELLHNQGEIPNATIPVLEDRLAHAFCICGESLDPEDTDGIRRRKNIQDMVEESRKADEIKSTITDLFYGSKVFQPGHYNEEESWQNGYARIVKRRDELSILQDEHSEVLKSLEVKLDEIPDTDIKGLRDTKRQYADQRDRFHALLSKNETQLENLNKERQKLVAQRHNMLREQKKYARILAELEVAQDVEDVLRRSYERITHEELAKVSELMNEIFLEMIGADSEQGAIIRRAEISQQFDILVYGPNDRVLNPDRDLNGASRRALTLSFILALTNVSEVEAPNVIDTPLGMMSGFVKRSVLQTTIRESSQLILFLTRAEILNCEEILDTEAGRIITLTNPAHYPRMLVNDPQVAIRSILRCECSHRQECSLCRRRTRLQSEVEMTS